MTARQNKVKNPNGVYYETSLAMPIELGSMRNKTILCLLDI